MSSSSPELFPQVNGEREKGNHCPLGDFLFPPASAAWERKSKVQCLRARYSLSMRPAFPLLELAHFIAEEMHACSLPALYQKYEIWMYGHWCLIWLKAILIVLEAIAVGLLHLVSQFKKKCQFWHCWLKSEVPIMDHIQPFKYSLSPLSWKGEVDAISIQWKIKWNMQGTCFYFQTIILNLSNEEWVILHQHNPRLNHFLMWKPNHFNRPRSHRQSKKAGSKIAIKLYCCS